MRSVHVHVVRLRRRCSLRRCLRRRRLALSRRRRRVGGRRCRLLLGRRRLRRVHDRLARADQRHGFGLELLDLEGRLLSLRQALQLGAHPRQPILGLFALLGNLGLVLRLDVVVHLACVDRERRKPLDLLLQLRDRIRPVLSLAPAGECRRERVGNILELGLVNRLLGVEAFVVKPILHRREHGGELLLVALADKGGQLGAEVVPVLVDGRLERVHRLRRLSDQSVLEGHLRLSFLRLHQRLGGDARALGSHRQRHPLDFLRLLLLGLGRGGLRSRIGSRLRGLLAGGIGSSSVSSRRLTLRGLRRIGRGRLLFGRRRHLLDHLLLLDGDGRLEHHRAVDVEPQLHLDLGGIDRAVLVRSARRDVGHVELADLGGEAIRHVG
mmetsp:Transcript_42585/g.106068  ORF Transcript_42585/g.106068 Transcript_42585/m.106068 type:complete len:382 (-) Transcript_42585:1461-2606(-)